MLTTNTWEQAEERAGDGRENKGWEAAAAAMEMAVLFRRMRDADRVASQSASRRMATRLSACRRRGLPSRPRRGV